MKPGLGTRDWGLGDTLARIFAATRLNLLARIYTRLTGRECRCAERREWLNKRFPYSYSQEKQDETMQDIQDENRFRG